MKVGVIIADRGDRPQFVENMWRMLNAQTVMPYSICVKEWPPVSEKADITTRYREAYQEPMFNPCDVIAFIENDDWYSPTFLEVMLNEWDHHERPDLFGTRQTIYYHLKLKKWMTMKHEMRSPAMSTLIKPGLKFPWPLPHDPYTDAWLWNLPHLYRTLFLPEKTICIGMKHGVGKTGGGMHNDNLHRYTNDDSNMDWLRETVDKDSFEFYKSISKKLNA